MNSSNFYLNPFFVNSYKHNCGFVFFPYSFMSIQLFFLYLVTCLCFLSFSWTWWIYFSQVGSFKWINFSFRGVALLSGRIFNHNRHNEIKIAMTRNIGEDLQNFVLSQCCSSSRGNWIWDANNAVYGRGECRSDTKSIDLFSILATIDARGKVVHIKNGEFTTFLDKLSVEVPFLLAENRGWSALCH